MIFIFYIYILVFEYSYILLINKSKIIKGGGGGIFDVICDISCFVN